MSYILDALKKSEQERGHGTAPNVQTLHSSSLNYHAAKLQLWPYLLLAAIIINLAALMYFMTAKPDNGASSRVEQSVADTKSVATGAMRSVEHQPVIATAQQAEDDEVILYKPVSMPGASRQVKAETPEATAAWTSTPQQTRGAVLEREELPADVQQHIPVMEFSAHVYSTNPLQRSIVINGRFLEEGDRLSSDLFLTEITPDGAIFDFQGQHFHQGVVSAWN